MRAYYRILLTSLVVSGFLFACSKGKEVQTTNQVKAAVTFIAGNVKLESNGDRRQLAIGDILTQGDVIITETDATADLAIRNFGVVKVGSSTRVKVEALAGDTDAGSAEIGLEKGNIVSIINRKSKDHDYRVVTPTAVAGVRGTIFMTSVENDSDGEDSSTRISVLSGSVAVKADGADEVIIPEESEMEIRRGDKISRESIRPLNNESLQRIRELSILHKTNVSEYNSLMEDIQNSMPEIKALEKSATAEDFVEQRSREEAKRGSAESVKKAERADITRTIQRDVKDDPIVLEPESGFKE
jgi:hypothetical protein